MHLNVLSRAATKQRTCALSDTLSARVLLADNLGFRMANNPMDDIRSLVERWCDRRQYNALAIILPAWTSNNGLTDGWSTLRDDLKHAYAMCTDLPDDERDELKGIYVAIDTSLQDR